jgi:tetratricopeptide (TPR) repeat protein
LFSGGKVIRLHKLSEFEEALSLDDQGQRDNAVKLYLKAINNGESLGDAYCNLGIIEWQQSHTAKAVDYFTLALQNNPRHFEAHYNLANLYGELGNFLLAKAHYRISIEIQPSFPNSHFNLALTFAMNQEFDEAVKCLMQYRDLAAPADHQLADDLIVKLSSAK